MAIQMSQAAVIYAMRQFLQKAERPDDGSVMEAEERDETHQSSAINLSTPRGRASNGVEGHESVVSSVIRSTSKAAARPASPTTKSHDSAAGAAPMMMPPGLQHMQQLIQQHLSPAQFQNFFQQQGLLVQQQHHQLAELNKKQTEDAVRQLQEQLQITMYQQNQVAHDKGKSAALSLHHSHLMQQMQMLQQRYLLHQAGMGQPVTSTGLATSEPTAAAHWDKTSDRRSDGSSPPYSTSRSPPPLQPLSAANGLLPALTNGRWDGRNGGDDERHASAADDDEAAAKTGPLFSNGICNWPGCETSCPDRPAFVKHLNTEHRLDDRSTAHVRVQMQVVQQMETNLAKEKARLSAMMAHLHMTRERMEEVKTDPPMAPSLPQVSAAMFPTTTPPSQLLSGNPFLRTAMLHAPAPASIGPSRRRVNDKPMTSSPYEESPAQRRRAAERSGQDITEELGRNRDFYRSTDIRPPFTYASLIRQAIVESPDKQLTLNEIYSWFQNTFAYFRRNAATWKNAVRHNLSLHKCFTRVENVKGAVWTVDEVEFCKRRPQRSTGQARSPTLSSSPTLYGDAINASLQSALADSTLPFMTNAADRLREMREREAPTLLGMHRRSPSPRQYRHASPSPDQDSRGPAMDMFSQPLVKSDYDAAHSPDPDSRDGGATREGAAAPPISRAENLSMSLIKSEYADGGQTMAETATA
ncbi:forkhead box protein P1-like isoform X2 [Pollicipes pollicipes]|uniref:forkhead box protein P1-like isoform X2 n=1 Tax=Pollicipes pollicipes TaxID=41117 RepID=UPI001884E665|nr:forkhead box protein P1-like isoform X2 [Pollicipes pollicipes]